MNGVRKLAILILAASFAAVAPTPSFGDSWQKPRKEPEVIKEKEKEKRDSKDQGSERGSKEDSKKKDEKKKKPNF